MEVDKIFGSYGLHAETYQALYLKINQLFLEVFE